METEIKNPKTILIIDDTEANIDMMLAILKDYDLIPVISGAEALEILEEERVDLILLDILMPGTDGFTVCRTLKANPKTAEIPVIFITAKSDEESIEEAYSIGGIDYVTKPFKPRELLARVRTQFRLQDTMQELEFLATRDSLTGIYNRRKFFELAKAMYQQHDNIFGVMIDVDHFKRINDEHGHNVGDIALKKITQTIQSLLPKDAIFGRMGGEEFAVILQAPTQEEALSIIENFRIAVAELPVLSDDKTIHCTISNGLAQKGLHTNSLDGLLREADAALYSAKNAGRNQAIFRSS